MKKLGLLALLVLLSGCVQSGDPATAASSQTEKTQASRLVEEARYTVITMRDHFRHGQKVRDNMANAKAVVIFPELLKGAFFVGGEGGSGILLARAADGRWTYPAFYKLASASFGLQVGGQSSEMMLIVMNNRGLAAILDKNVKLGADLSAAVGGQGEGIEAATTANAGADIIAYSTTRGGFIGASVEGAIISELPNLDAAYYEDATATARRVVIEGRHVNPHADPLRNLLQELSARP